MQQCAMMTVCAAVCYDDSVCSSRRVGHVLLHASEIMDHGQRQVETAHIYIAYKARSAHISYHKDTIQTYTMQHTCLALLVSSLHHSKPCTVTAQQHVATHAGVAKKKYIYIFIYIRYFWQGNHQIYGHIRCVCTILANPTHTHTYTCTYSHTCTLCTHLQCMVVRLQLLAARTQDF